MSAGTRHFTPSGETTQAKPPPPVVGSGGFVESTIAILASAGIAAAAAGLAGAGRVGGLVFDQGHHFLRGLPSGESASTFRTMVRSQA
jgi:hypothetical protein